MQEHDKDSLIDSNAAAFVGRSHFLVVAILVFVTVEMIVSQIFYAGEWWGVRSLSLSLLLALAPSSLLTILFVVVVNWLVDRHDGDRAAARRKIERSTDGSRKAAEAPDDAAPKPRRRRLAPGTRSQETSFPTARA